MEKYIAALETLVKALEKEVDIGNQLRKAQSELIDLQEKVIVELQKDVSHLQNEISVNKEADQTVIDLKEEAFAKAVFFAQA